MARPARVCRRMIAAMTANSSADIGMTRSRSVLDGAMTSSAMTSPLGRWYWRTLRWVSSRSSSTRTPLCLRTSTVLSAGQVTDTDVGLPAATLAFLVGEAPGTLIGAALNSEGFAGSQR